MTNKVSPIISSPFSEAERTGKGIFGDAYIYRLGDEEKNSGLLYSWSSNPNFTSDLCNRGSGIKEITSDLRNLRTENENFMSNLCNLRSGIKEITSDIDNLRTGIGTNTVGLSNLRTTIGVNTILILFKNY